MRQALLKRKILNAGAFSVSYLKLIPWLFKLNKNSTVIDCGANTGHIASFLSITGAAVYAFEPDPIAFAILKKRCGHKENIHCINKGVWDKNTTIQLYRHQEMMGEPDFTVSSTIVAEKRNINRETTVEIEVIDIIEFIRSLPKRVDLVKIDIEGAEIEVLKKIIESNAHHLFKMMYVETHETKITGYSDELHLLKQMLRNKGINNIKLNWI